MGLRKLLLKGLRYKMPLRIPFSAAMTIQSSILLLWNRNFQYAYANLLSLVREFPLPSRVSIPIDLGAFTSKVRLGLLGSVRKDDFEVTDGKLRAWVIDDPSTIENELNGKVVEIYD